MRLKVILATLFIMAIVILAISTICSTRGQHSINGEAVLIEGTMIAINWDASEETWEQAHAKWLELK